jgi:hypothetical protein
MPLSRLGTVCGGVPMAWMTNETPTSSTFGQLSDYIAMVGLADIDPEEDYVPHPTIRDRIENRTIGLALT